MEQASQGGWLINRKVLSLFKHMLDMLIMAITPTSIRNHVTDARTAYSLSTSLPHHAGCRKSETWVICPSGWHRAGSETAS